MFAVIKTGGKQYKVAKDDVIRVEKLDAAAGDMIALEEVLMVGDAGAQTVGTPLVSGASVAATVLDQARADKIIVFKKRRRKDYQRKRGHRQDLTVLRITDILTEGQKAPAKKTAAKKADSAEEQSQAPADKPAAKRAGGAKAAAKAPTKKAPAKKAKSKE